MVSLKNTRNSYSFPQLFLRGIFSWQGLVSLNIIFLTVMVLAAIDMTYLIMNEAEDTESIERVMSGLATIFVAYGVALEEREFLMKTVGYYPQNQNSQQMKIDHISHHYGVLLLIVGLVIEVGMQFIKIPDRFIDIISFELFAYLIGFVCFVMIGYWLLRFCYKLINNKNCQIEIIQ